MSERSDALMIEANGVATTWITATLNDDDINEERDVSYFFAQILHPYMVAHGSSGGLALCEALVCIAAGLADIANRDDPRKPVIEVSRLIDDGQSV